MASYELISEDVIAKVNQTRKNLYELAEVIKKDRQLSNRSESDDMLAVLAGSQRKIDQIEKNIKETNKYYLYLNKEIEADDTLVSEEVMEKNMCALAVIYKNS
ncbi:hypothetical protein ISN45_At02g010040 [Arabidopsis thaliana x Arabidopsis arenosa]|uniref:Uncharacterized protein n=1 Tax=Arabidopsis thaliana x Arabidopsis arenosa TaxID=1240361 RepID=A0A8T2FJT5_9BRAS|nr:hypothetical protein ISN45_At02g010040 [Arabidopsis thaliana x Arabidopsis arenosa]